MRQFLVNNSKGLSHKRLLHKTDKVLFMSAAGCRHFICCHGKGVCMRLSFHILARHHCTDATFRLPVLRLLIMSAQPTLFSMFLFLNGCGKTHEQCNSMIMLCTARTPIYALYRYVYMVAHSVRLSASPITSLLGWHTGHATLQIVTQGSKAYF
jgi:hypothetical protein